MSKVSMPCPTLLQALVITDDAHLAAKLTCKLARPGFYLPIVDGPRINRPDAHAEVIRRHNAAAKVDPKTVFLAGLSADVIRLLGNELPPKIIQLVASATDISSIRGSRSFKEPPLQWGRDRIGVGLLKALRSGRDIEFTEQASPIESIPTKSDHLVVCEQGSDLTQVIAANYAFSLRAGLHLIPDVSQPQSEQILESFYTGSVACSSEAIEALARTCAMSPR
jgi:hypothetical protein